MTGAAGPGRRIRVARLVLAEFRSYARARLDFDGRPVALIGPNGAGKTNLLEAVSTLSPGRGLRRATAEEMARGPGAHGWRVSAELVGADGRPREIVVEAPADGRKRVSVDGKPEPQTALAALVPMLWLTPAMDRLWIEGAEGRRRFLDRAVLAFEPEHAARAAAYEKAMRERNRLLRDGPADPLWLDALEARMAETGAAVAGARLRAARRLMRAQEGAKTLFPKAQIAILGDMETRIAEAAAGAADTAVPAEAEADAAEAHRGRLARARRDDAAAGRALEGPHRSDLSAVFAAKGIEARACSTGEQKALLVSLVLANARAVAEDAGAAPVLLLDELAAHFDPDRRAALFDEICAMGAHAFMTGAEAALFAPLGERAQRLAVADGPDGSTVAAA